MRVPLFSCSVAPISGSGTRCRLPPVYDALLRSCRSILLAVLADLCRLLISLFPATVVSSASAGRTGTPLRLPSSSLLVLLRYGLLLP
jgi:hypothetical protein